MSNTNDWIFVGRFGKVHGIKGFITVHSYTEPRENILQYPDWYAYINSEWQLVTLVSQEITDKHILVKVEGYFEREQAANLTNIEIGTKSEFLPVLKPGEYYWSQLIGLQVINQTGDTLGKVVEILPTGANDVLIVEGDKRRLIPYLPEHSIIAVNISEGQIIVDWDLDF